MICPHCSTNVVRKQRWGRRCGSCRREFALEPKENSLQLHDVRMRRLVAKLSKDGRLRYTVSQLWFAAARKTLVESENFSFTGPIVAGSIAVGMFLIGVIFDVGTLAFFAFLPGVLAVIWLIRELWEQSHKGRVQMTQPEFRTTVLDRWLQVYHAPPPGLVDEHQPPPQVAVSPRIALLCPDPSVAACLYANQVPEQYGILPVPTPDRLPAEIPVLIVHDASAQGCLFAARMRRSITDRMVYDVGMRPRSVMGKTKNTVRLRAQQPAEQEMGELRSYGLLTSAETAWLAEGWWSPVAAIPPGKLIGTITAAAGRVVAATDPYARKAQSIGFLTWPNEIASGET